MTQHGRRACIGEQFLSLRGNRASLTRTRFMGAITNNSRKLANFAGFYKGIQSAGAAIIWRLDGLESPPPYMNLFASCWVLLASSLVIALPVVLLKIKDTVPVEEDLKFTDEAIEDVMGYEVVHDSSELKKV